ncbi:MAG TPA: hypothetical protein VJ872_13890 [Nocardioides sp.]|nr:hypothetical protein [Nocardioides sp.]
MNYCTNCGHELGVGRFCTNCGQPVAGRHPATPAAPTAAPAADPAAPTVPRPVVGTLPPPPRFPLYAEPAPLPPQPPRRSSLLPWLVVGLALLVAGAAVGAVLLFRSGGGHAVDATPSGPAASVATTAPTSASATPTTPSSGTDVSSDIGRIGVPGTAPASTDLAGNPVTFGRAHLVDGDTQTAWRVAGDASGRSITISFDTPVTLTSVGLVNGYAKSYQGYNGYLLNRRITAVRWTFEDGTSITQRLQQTPTMQSVPVAAGPTSSLRLQILSTVASPRQNWRDFTAISELSLLGSK